MRYELTDHEWAAIKPLLPNKPRGVPRVNDRRVLNGIFWVLRSGASWRDLPQQFGPYGSRPFREELYRKRDLLFAIAVLAHVLMIRYAEGIRDSLALNLASSGFGIDGQMSI